MKWKMDCDMQNNVYKFACIPKRKCKFEKIHSNFDYTGFVIYGNFFIRITNLQNNKSHPQFKVRVF